MRILIITLGDFGRSPRMQYHAVAAANEGADVDVLAYGGRSPIAAVLDSPRIRIHALPTAKSAGRPELPKLAFLILGVLRTIREFFLLLWRCVVQLDRPDVILVQNPPALPVLAVAVVAQRLRRSRLIVDWHNFGWSMLRLRLGPRHAAVRVAGAMERWLGTHADAHFCVSQAMQKMLLSFGCRDVHVLRDRPAELFRHARTWDRDQLATRADLNFPNPGSKILVSSTSWTADEDFGLLLDALRICDQRFNASGNVALHLVITGDGPLREEFEARFATAKLQHVRLATVWLSTDDYAALLRSADLGICLHTSTSGVDLPMKALDMFGAGLPVCAFDYGPCVAELFTEENSVLFRDSKTLAACIEQFCLHEDASERLATLREGVARMPQVSWEEGWGAEARAAIFGD